MKKIYNSTGVGMAAFLGGPLAAGYLLSKNYDAFDKKNQSKNSIIISLIITIIVFGSIAVIPESVEEKIPNYLFPIIFLGISRLIVEKYQKSDISSHISNGGEFYSNWRTAGISPIFAVITFAAAMVTFIVLDLFVA